MKTPNNQDVIKSIDLISKLYTLALRTAVGIGALIVLCYCIKIRFFPSDISFGDGILFVWASISFGFTYSIYVYASYSIGAILFLIFHYVISLRKIILPESSKEKRWKLTRLQASLPRIKKTSCPIIIAGVFLGSLIIILQIQDYTFEAIQFISSSFIVFSGFTFFTKFKKQKEKILFLVTIYLIPLIIGGYLGRTLDQSMRMIGIRYESPTIRIDKEYFQFISSRIEDELDIKIDNYGNTKKFKILFTGIGTNTLIQIHTTKGNMNFIVPNKHIYKSF